MRPLTTAAVKMGQEVGKKLLLLMAVSLRGETGLLGPRDLEEFKGISKSTLLVASCAERGTRELLEREVWGRIPPQ